MSNKAQLQTNNTELQDILNIIAALPNAADLGVGTYIWQKSGGGGGTTEYVVSDNPTAYPDDGEQGGFTYKKIQTTETSEITPGTTDQTIDALTLLLNTLTVKGDADLVANNIRSGVDIFGVIGTMVQGNTDVDYGTVTFTEYKNDVTVSHNLGVTPSHIFMLNLAGFDLDKYGTTVIAIVDNTCLHKERMATVYGYQFVAESVSCVKTTSTITFDGASYFQYMSYTTYVWFAIA